jgi:hypothetical protein
MITERELSGILTRQKDKTVFEPGFSFFYSKVTSISDGLVRFEMEDGTPSLTGYLTGEPNLAEGDVILVFQRGANDYVAVCKLQTVIN